MWPRFGHVCSLPCLPHRGFVCRIPAYQNVIFLRAIKIDCAFAATALLGPVHNSTLHAAGEKSCVFDVY